MLRCPLAAGLLLGTAFLGGGDALGAVGGAGPGAGTPPPPSFPPSTSITSSSSTTTVSVTSSPAALMMERVILRFFTPATAPGWSTREPCFYPEWVEKEAA